MKAGSVTMEQAIEFALNKNQIILHKETDMKDNSLYKLGGICAILLAVSNLVAGVTGALIPSNLWGVPNAQSPFMYWEENKILLLTNWWALLLGAVFALAVIPAISKTVQHLNEGWVRWMSTLATIAFAVVILDNYWSIVLTTARANAYITGNEAIRATLSVPGAPQQSDVQGWLANGAVGLYVLVVSLLALRENIWPKGLAYMGVFSALYSFLSLAALVIPSLVLSGLGTILAGISALFIPIWLIWVGIFLRRLGSSVEPTT
jgi:hypothetical protein